MLKQKLAISLLLLANIFLLVQTIMPHHHHDRTLCINYLHCQHDENSHKSNVFQAHKHDDNAKSEECNLRKSVVTPRLSKHDSKFIYVHINPDFYGDLYAIYNRQSDLLSELQLISFLSHTQVVFYFSKFVGHAHGLRAPPLV